MRKGRLPSMNKSFLWEIKIVHIFFLVWTYKQRISSQLYDPASLLPTGRISPVVIRFSWDIFLTQFREILRRGQLLFPWATVYFYLRDGLKNQRERSVLLIVSILPYLQPSPLNTLAKVMKKKIWSSCFAHSFPVISIWMHTLSWQTYPKEPDEEQQTHNISKDGSCKWNIFLAPCLHREDVICMILHPALW